MDDDECQKDCDDKKLIDEALDGSEQAFRRLVECNQDKLFAAMFRMLGCHYDAEEAVQEAFVRAFLRLDSFDQRCKFSTWLYRIAFNSAITDKRRKRPQISLDQQLEDYGHEAVDGDAVDAADMMVREEHVQLVHEALDNLSDDHRAILVLREFDDLAYEEIGEVLNISAGTVRSRLSRARNRLREAVEEIQLTVAHAEQSDE